MIEGLEKVGGIAQEEFDLLSSPIVNELPVVAPAGGTHFQKADFLKSSVARFQRCPYWGNPFSEI